MVFCDTLVSKTLPTYRPNRLTFTGPELQLMEPLKRHLGRPFERNSSPKPSGANDVISPAVRRLPPVTAEAGIAARRAGKSLTRGIPSAPGVWTKEFKRAALTLNLKSPIARIPQSIEDTKIPALGYPAIEVAKWVQDLNDVACWQDTGSGIEC